MSGLAVFALTARAFRSQYYGSGKGIARARTGARVCCSRPECHQAVCAVCGGGLYIGLRMYHIAERVRPRSGGTVRGVVVIHRWGARRDRRAMPRKITMGCVPV